MKVFEAALVSAMCYGCEAWLTRDLSSVNVMYLNAIRELLGVRKTTANDLCLLELGLPSLKAKTRAIQKRFFSKILEERRNMTDDPFMYVWKLVRDTGAPTTRYIKEVLGENDVISADLVNRINMLNISERSKFVTYNL